MRVSKDVTYQYQPFVEELDPTGQTNTWIGQFHQGLLEQMYQNRVIFLLNMTCPVYCRFCFRKHKESRNQQNPTVSDVDRAVEHIRNSPSVKEIVITGGDPFLNRENLARAIDGLKEIPHVQALRLATRSVSYDPHLFLGDNGSLLTYLKRKNLELRLKGKRMELATHFIHPDEVSVESLRIITDLVQNGIPVYVQTPFLKDCNDQGPELTRLFHLLRGAGAELHYIYIPCSPIHGNQVYWTPFSEGLKAAHYLRAHLSDRVIPRICTATAIGKIDWFSSGWAVEQVQGDGHYVWMRTPYTPEYFKAFASLSDEDAVRENAEGTLDCKFMARIGDPSLFMGARPPRKRPPVEPDPEARKTLAHRSLEDQRDTRSIVETGSEHALRLHETRMELHAEASEGDLDLIRRAEQVTDVIISARDDILEDLHRIAGLVKKIQEIPHVHAIRLRSLLFKAAPHRYTPAVLDHLGRLNRLDIGDPKRLEIETEFLHAGEVRKAHRIAALALSDRGVTVYANTPLLSGVNDDPDEMNRLAYSLRESGIEFHHLFVSGHRLQKTWNRENPLDVADVIDIATRVRRDGSGREIPRYILQTPLGDVDFGLTSRMMRQDGKITLRLSPYDMAYYRAMDPGFDWPQGVQVDSDGRPIVEIEGLKDSAGFMVF
jgi:KamA family protein